MLRWPYKDPDDVLDYEIDWTERLNGDTISSSTFTLPVGATLVADSTENTTTATKVWLSGGTDGESYEIRNRVVTAAGRTMDQTVRLRVRTK